MKKFISTLITLFLLSAATFSQQIPTTSAEMPQWYPGQSEQNVNVASVQASQLSVLQKSTIKTSSAEYNSPENTESQCFSDFSTIYKNSSTRNAIPLDYATEFNGSLDGWTSVSIVGGKNFIWTTTGGAYGGQLNSTTASNGYAMFDNLNGANIGPNPAEAALVSPALDFSNAAGVLMSFEHMARHLGQGFGAAYPNLLIKVEASTDLFNTDIQEIWSYQFPSTAHMVVQGLQLVDLGALAGESEVHVRFRYIGGGGYWWLIDDIFIFETFNNDLALLQAKFSQDLNFEDDDVTLTAVVTNLGLQTQTNKTVTFNIDGQDFFGNITSIAPLEQVEVTAQWIDASAGRHLLTITLPDDENNSNNTGTTQGVVATPGNLAEGFEGALFPPTLWEADPEWINWVQTWSPQWEGLKSAAAGNNLGFSNSKLITPFLDILTGDELNFYATVGNNIVGQPTTIQMMYSQDKVSWTNIGSLINLTAVMALYTIDLTPIANGSYYLAFSASGAPSGSTWSTWAIVDHVVGPAINIPECPQPTGINATGIATTEANIGWTAGGSEVLWNIEVGAPNFTPGTGNEIMGETGTGNNPWLAKNLDPGTTYHAYVQADCGGDGESPWAGPLVFTTLCEFTCPPGAIAESEACGENLNGGCNMTTPAFETITSGDILCGTVWAEGGSRDTDWFELILTEPTEVILHAYAEVPVNFGLLNYGSGTPGNPVCPATAFIEIATTALCTPVTLDLGILVAGTHWLFVGLPVYEGYPCSINYWLEVETVEVECPPPSALTATNITQTSADLGWTAGGTESSWNVEVGAPGFIPGTGAEILSVTGTMDNPWTASPLSSATVHEFYVQADCGSLSRMQSEWAGPFQFSTLCGTYNLPYTEDFGSLSVGQIPVCWSKSDLGPDNWGAVLTGNAGGSSPEMMLSWNPEFDGVSRLITPALNTGGKLDLMIRLDQYLDDWADNDGEYIALEYSVDGGTNWTEFWQYVCTANYGPVYDLIPFTLPANTDEFHIAFKYNGYSFNIDFWYFDNILIDELKYPVTFNVDVTTIAGFDHNTEVVYIAGDFPGATWNEPGSNPDLLMSRVGLTDVYTITLDLPPANYQYKYFRNATWNFGEWSGGPNRNIVVAAVTATEDVFGGDITFANLQWPAGGTITEGGSFTAYGQAFIPNGITGTAGATFGLEAWVGVSTDDTNPAGWSTWVPATFNGQAGDNDEFQSDIASGLTPGTYYYAYRYRFGLVYGEYLYGGFSGGFWDGTTNVSGVLTVNAAGPPPYMLVEGAVDDCVDATDEVEIVGATVENGAVAGIRSGGIITATDFEVKDGGTAYLTAATSITLGNDVLITPGATGLFLAKIDTFEPCVLVRALVASEEEIIPVIPSTESFFKVFPNPTTGNFKLELLSADEADINVEIYGMMGEKVFQDRLFGSMLYEFDLSNMPRGIYFIRVLKGDEMGIEKVIKQ